VGFVLVCGVREALAAAVRRGLPLHAPRLRNWVLLVAAYAGAGFLGGLARAALTARFLPGVEAALGSWPLVAAMTLAALTYALVIEALTALGQRHETRLAAAHALREALAASRGETVATDDAQRRALAELFHGRFQAHLVVAAGYLLDVRTAEPAAQGRRLAEARAVLAGLRETASQPLAAARTPSRLPVALVEEVVARFREIRPVAFTGDAAGRLLAAPVADAAALLLTEALLNAHRHAGSCAVAVTLRPLGDDALELAIADDGRGFAPGAVRTGLGLAGLGQGLVEQGGRWELAAAPGKGTRITLRLPAEVPT
jgi:signal transduction histidine kinase